MGDFMNCEFITNLGLQESKNTFDDQEFEKQFADYLNEQLDEGKIKIEKAELIAKHFAQIKCFSCLDSGKLYNERDFFSKFDGKGSYATYSCYNCKENQNKFCYNISYFDSFSENGRKVYKYPGPSIQDVAYELGNVYENLTDWDFFIQLEHFDFFDVPAEDYQFERIASSIYSDIYSRIYYSKLRDCIPYQIKYSTEKKLKELYLNNIEKKCWCETTVLKGKKIYLFFKYEKGKIRTKYEYTILGSEEIEKKEEVRLFVTVAKLIEGETEEENEEEDEIMDEWIENMGLSVEL